MNTTDILLVYSGKEQGTWGDIACRKERYYHYLPGILYLAAALKKDTSASWTVATRHYNASVQSPDEILADMTSIKPRVIGLSSYCWNIALHLDLAVRLKKQLPDVKIMVGGPEISMRSTGECDRFFAAHDEIDLLVFGEAESRISLLAGILLNEKPKETQGIHGFAFHPRHGIEPRVEIRNTVILDEIPRIYPATIDVRVSNGTGIHVVYETSRGCPNRCIYCEFIRYRKRQDPFPLNRVIEELSWLLEQNVDGIHFSDAVFDNDPAVTRKILRLLIEKNCCTTILCYCSFKSLDEEMADLFERLQCQIGVGVQSTNPEVLHTLQRFSPARMFEKAKKLLAGKKVNFYTDLMFGLPRDNLESFKRSFDTSARINPAFMMLFPLSLIRGTRLGDSPEQYGVTRYSDESVRRLGLECEMDYHNIGLADDFRLEDLHALDDVTITCFYYYNRFPFSLRHLQNRCGGSIFDLYRRIGAATKAYLRSIGQRASNTRDVDGDTLLRIFMNELLSMGTGPTEQDAFTELFKLDLLRLMVMRSPRREQIFRVSKNAGSFESVPSVITPETKLVRMTFGKVVTLRFPWRKLRNLHAVRENLSPEKSGIYIHAPFNHAGTSIVEVTAPMLFFVELLPDDRALRMKTVIATLSKRLRSGISEEMVVPIARQFHRESIIRFLE